MVASRIKGMFKGCLLSVSFLSFSFFILMVVFVHLLSTGAVAWKHQTWKHACFVWIELLWVPELPLPIPTHKIKRESMPVLCGLNYYGYLNYLFPFRHVKSYVYIFFVHPFPKYLIAHPHRPFLLIWYNTYPQLWSLIVMRQLKMTVPTAALKFNRDEAVEVREVAAWRAQLHHILHCLSSRPLFLTVIC